MELGTLTRRSCEVAARIGAVALVLVMTAGADRAEAQDVAGGYTFLRMEGLNLPAGWWVAASGQATPVVSAIAEVSRSTRSEEMFGVHADVSALIVGGGVRVMSPRGLARPFGDVMIGVGRLTGSVSGLPPGVGIDSIEESTTAFAVQPGAGVDVDLARQLAMRVRLEATMLRAEGDWGFGPRFTVGVVYRWMR